MRRFRLSEQAETDLRQVWEYIAKTIRMRPTDSSISFMGALRGSGVILSSDNRAMTCGPGSEPFPAGAM